MISMTFSHAAISMLVTSLTTAAAFLTDLINSVVALKCFGLFASFTILINYLYVITWLLAALVWLDRFQNYPQQILSKNAFTVRFLIKIRTIYELLDDCGRIFFEKLLPYVVIKLRYFSLVSLGVLAVVSGISILYRPGIRLATFDYFQLFKASHPMERYERELKQQFAFHRLLESKFPLPVRFVWGLKPEAHASLWNPDDMGNFSQVSDFKFDSSLDLLWLNDFCLQLDRANFTERGFLDLILPFCFVPDFLSWMNERLCLDPITRQDQRPCCNQTRLPYPKGTVEKCLVEASSRLLVHGPMIHMLKAGPYFRKGTRNLSAIVVEFFSKHKFSFSFTEMADFYTKISQFGEENLSQAPGKMRSGFFTSDYYAMRFYDLQRSLVENTKISVGISVAIAFFVLLLSTLNGYITVLAILTITCVIFVTIAALVVLLGWELNVLESTIIILTVGLSFDYTLHYAIAYKIWANAPVFSPPEDRESRVIGALGAVGTAIFMSAVTTGVAGLAMLPADTLAYFQIGLFMVFITCISWTYATFFFVPLLYICGPKGDSGSCMRIVGRFRYITAPTEDSIGREEQEELEELRKKVGFTQAIRQSLRRASLPLFHKLSTSTNLGQSFTRRFSADAASGQALSNLDDGEMHPMPSDIAQIETHADITGNPQQIDCRVVNNANSQL